MKSAHAGIYHGQENFPDALGRRPIRKRDETSLCFDLLAQLGLAMGTTNLELGGFLVGRLRLPDQFVILDVRQSANTRGTPSVPFRRISGTPPQVSLGSRKRSLELKPAFSASNRITKELRWNLWVTARLRAVQDRLSTAAPGRSVTKMGMSLCVTSITPAARRAEARS